MPKKGRKLIKAAKKDELELCPECKKRSVELCHWADKDGSEHDGAVCTTPGCHFTA